jgi:transmembrane sensor
MDASDRRKRAAEEAAEWWLTLQGDVSRSEREQYVLWLRESALHVAEMLRIGQVHSALTRFKRWEQIPTDDPESSSGEVIELASVGSAARLGVPLPAKRSRPLMLAAVAAGMLVVLVGAAAFLYLMPDQVIQTERGERREVALADGSVVQVDPETRLRVAYEANIRSVFLQRGRALFHVAKNAHRPFVVKVDDTTVRAVGTAFAVEQGQDSVVVTVAEGKVAVRPSHAVDAEGPQNRSDGSSPSQAQNRHDELPKLPPVPASRVAPVVVGMARTPQDPLRAVGGEIVLTANEQVIVEDSGTAEPVREVDSQRALAWAEGRLVFDNDSVEYAVREFNRYNRIQLTVHDAALARRTISGVFSAADPESFVAFIQSVAPVHITRDDAADIAIDSAR